MARHGHNITTLRPHIMPIDQPDAVPLLRQGIGAHQANNTAPNNTNFYIFFDHVPLLFEKNTT